MILNLAGFRIRIMIRHSTDHPRLSVHHASLLSKGPEEFLIEILYSDEPGLTESLMGFAPAAMDLPRLVSGDSACFWKMDYDPPMIRLSGVFPGELARSHWEMTLNTLTREGTVRIPTRLKNADPLKYPIDALIIYYLALFGGGAIIHASGVDFARKGYLFAGNSGAGKSTIARYCQLAGARILHDDRIVVRRTNGEIIAHRMPVYPGSLPASMPLDKIYFIEKSDHLYEIPLPDQVTFEKLAGHAVQHPFHGDLISRQISNIISIVESTPGFRLGFPPDPETGRFLQRLPVTARRPAISAAAP